ncbi:MAG: ATP-binding protein [Elusimicrobiota bacterium]
MLALDILKSSKDINNTVVFNCDNPTDREMLSNRDIEFLTKLVGQAKIIFIDEGQKVDTIGQTLKLLVDYYKNEKQVFITGSSSRHLLDGVQESLTGRKYVYTLFPLSLEEVYPKKNFLKFQKEIEQYLIFGMYPDVINKDSFQEKKEVLRELTSSYLYKDIFELESIRNSDVLAKLVKALALQIGSEVSTNELSRFLGIDKKTVDKYIDLLEKAFVLFRVSPFTRNQRKEISKSKKIYFYDLGIRNAIINNFGFVDSRDDIGMLWENFVMVERMKFRQYNNIDANQYFWRTYYGSEIDLVEEIGGKLFGYKFKWSAKIKNPRVPALWKEYKDASYTVINKESLDGFVF